MAQTAALLKTLKTCLKAQGKTYADVAQALKLSEASVKRLFAGQGFSLARLDAVCQMLGMEISDLVQQMQDKQHRLERLTPQQEQEITQDLELMLVLVCVMNRWTIDDITTLYVLSEADCVRQLVRLDKLGILNLLPNNRIQLRISPNFKWLENGPIQRFFREKIGQEYFNTSFGDEGECLIVLNGMLSSQSNGEFQRKMERVAKDFHELNTADAGLPFEARNGVTLVMAMRNWEFGLFSPMLRQNAQK